MYTARNPSHHGTFIPENGDKPWFFFGYPPCWDLGKCSEHRKCLRVGLMSWQAMLFQELLAPFGEAGIVPALSIDLFCLSRSEVMKFFEDISPYQGHSDSEIGAWEVVFWIFLTPHVCSCSAAGAPIFLCTGSWQLSEFMELQQVLIHISHWCFNLQLFFFTSGNDGKWWLTGGSMFLRFQAWKWDDDTNQKKHQGVESTNQIQWVSIFQIFGDRRVSTCYQHDINKHIFLSRKIWGFLETMDFNTFRWSKMTWMISGGTLHD